MQDTRPDNTHLEQTIAQLRRLPSETRDMAVSMIAKLAQAEGVEDGTDYKPSSENLGFLEGNPYSIQKQPKNGRQRTGQVHQEGPRTRSKPIH